MARQPPSSLTAAKARLRLVAVREEQETASTLITLAYRYPARLLLATFACGLLAGAFKPMRELVLRTATKHLLE